MIRLRLSWLAASVATCGFVAWAHAQNPEGAVPISAQALASQGSDVQALPQDIALQRQALAVKRDAILKSDEQRQAQCWQKFAVNACLIESRRIRRQALDPLAQQELALNALERAWRSEQRDLRLLGKQPANLPAPQSAP